MEDCIERLEGTMVAKPRISSSQGPPSDAETPTVGTLNARQGVMGVHLVTLEQSTSVKQLGLSLNSTVYGGGSTR